MSYEILPPAFEVSQHAFKVRQQTINKLSLAMSGYILFVLYPAYGLLRIIWADDNSVFLFKGVSIAILISIAFGLFARRTISRYMHTKLESG